MSNSSIKVSLQHANCNIQCDFQEKGSSRKIQGIIIRKINNTTISYYEIDIYKNYTGEDIIIGKPKNLTDIKSFSDEKYFYNFEYTYQGKTNLYKIQKIQIHKSSNIIEINTHKFSSYKKRSTPNYKYEIVYVCKEIDTGNILYVSIPIISFKNKDINLLQETNYKKNIKNQHTKNTLLDTSKLPKNEEEEVEGIKDINNKDNIQYDLYSKNPVFIFCNTITTSIEHIKNIEEQEQFFIPTVKKWSPFMFLPTYNSTFYTIRNDYITYTKTTRDTKNITKRYIHYIYPIHVPKTFFHSTFIREHLKADLIPEPITDYKYSKDSPNILEPFSNPNVITKTHKNIYTILHKIQYSISTNKNTILHNIFVIILMYYVYKIISYSVSRLL